MPTDHPRIPTGEQETPVAREGETARLADRLRKDAAFLRKPRRVQDSGDAGTADFYDQIAAALTAASLQQERLEALVEKWAQAGDDIPGHEGGAYLSCAAELNEILQSSRERTP